MTKIYDFKIFELNEIKRKNTIIGILSLVLGYLIAILLLIFHTRENSLIFCIISICSVVVFSIVGLIFLLILNAPIGKLKELVKKEKDAVVETYTIKSADEKCFSINGLSLRKLRLVSKEKEESVFYINKNIDLKNGEKIKAASVNSIIVSYEVLHEKA